MAPLRSAMVSSYGWHSSRRSTRSEPRRMSQQAGISTPNGLYDQASLRPGVSSGGVSAVSAVSASNLHRSVQTVAEVAEAGDDIFLRVEFAIDDRGIDDDVRMTLFDGCDA